MALEPRDSKRTWEVVLQVATVAAAVTAVFQQNDGLRAGAALVAGVLLVTVAWVAMRRHRPRRRRLTRRQLRIIRAYHEEVVNEIMQELPLPAPDTEKKLALKVSAKSAYVPVPYKAFPSGSYRTMHRRQLHPQPTDAVDMLVDLMNKRQSAIIVGDPGSGKTLLAAMTFAQMADAFRTTRGHSIVPLFIRLNTANMQGKAESSGQAIANLVPDALKDLGPHTLERLLDKGRACIILDGLDELPTTKAPRDAGPRMPDELAFILEKSTIVTCREAFHSLYVDTDRIAANLGVEIELLPLTSDQVVPFVQQYCNSYGHPELANNILAIFAHNASVAETLSRPLMLRMTVDVLSFELDQGESRAVERTLLTGSDFLNAQIYEQYVASWMIREHRKANHPSFTPFQKLALVEAIAWQIFCNPARTDAGYGSFEVVDLTIDNPTLLATVDKWIRDHANSLPRVDRFHVVAEIEERTFLIVSQRGDTYRFAHKSFFEYMVARHVYNELAQQGADVADLVTLMCMPFPDEIIDFIRELLHWSKTPEETTIRRHNVEQSLLSVVQAGHQPDDPLMARQQAANLLPIVATPATRQYLRQVVVSDDHPFIRRAIAVGEALHDQDPEFLDAFVASLDTDERSRTFHMGYNRIYYGDQPLSKTIFEDDGSPECSRFFRACIRHLQLDQYRYIRTMALATIRLMLNDPSRRSLLIEQERAGLLLVKQICERPDPELGVTYERERTALASCIDDALAGSSHAAEVNERDLASSLDQSCLESVGKTTSDGIVADDKEPGDPAQSNIKTINIEDTSPGFSQD